MDLKLPPELSAFAHPPASYRPMAFWVWNGDMTEGRIDEMLHEFAAQGFGGSFVHPRPGLVTEYLSERWFELWRYALEVSEQLGLECHIYDENSYPSGFAGGHTVATNPHTVAQVLVPDWSPEPTRGRHVATYVFADEGVPRALAKGEEAPAGAQVVHICLAAAPANLWNAGFPYVDLTRRETTDTFIQTTHEAYARECGNRFGRTVKYAFMDEPRVFSAHGGLAYSESFAREFRREHGYALLDELGPLLFTQAGSAAVRFDYWRTVLRLFLENFVKPLHAWCESHGLGLTGHFDEHTWPRPDHVPSSMAGYRWMQVPGNDLLGFQFEPGDWEKLTLAHLNLKELSSVANQLGIKRTLTESCGGGGYGMGPAQFKPLEDFLLVHGVNLLTPHISDQTVSGARKYDWPQTISDHAPWWESYRVHADHLARVAYALTQGEEINDILVLHPTTTAWTQFEPDGFHPNPRPRVWGNRAKEDSKAQREFLDSLRAAGIPYDLGDEVILEELGALGHEKGTPTVRVGKRQYRAVLLPPGLENLCASTAELLRGFLAGGGKVLAAGELPGFVNGRAADALGAESGKVLRPGRTEELLREAAMASQRVLRTADASPLPCGIFWMRKEVNGGTLWYFVNATTEPLACDVALKGRRFVALDTSTGDARGLANTHLELPPLGHALWFACPEGEPFAAAAEAPWQAAEVSLQSASPLSPNVLTLDYCDFEAPGGGAAGIPTILADARNWPVQGWPQNPWSRSIQYKRTFLDRPIDPASRLTVRYPFDLVDNLEDLALAIERPWLYQIDLNGVRIDSHGDPRYGQEGSHGAWFDEEIRALPLPLEALREGRNTVTLRAEPFHVLCEIAPAYLLGDFALQAAGKGFAAGAPKPLTLGAWQAQGMPFYCGQVHYQLTLNLPVPSVRVRLQFTGTEGSALTVVLDDRVATVVHSPWIAELTGPFAAGEQELTLLVSGNLQNQMGPHLAEGLPGAWTWSLAPEQQPGGGAYRFVDTGLQQLPKVSFIPSA